MIRFDYDEEYGWIVENDGDGASQIVAKDVLPSFGRWVSFLASNWKSAACVECRQTWPCDATVEGRKDGIPHRLGAYEHRLVFVDRSRPCESDAKCCRYLGHDGEHIYGTPTS